MAQVHRFRDLAALSLGEGPTRYMSATEARKAAKALFAVARSIETESFSDSPSLTVSFADIAHNDITAYLMATPAPRQRHTVKVWAHTLDAGAERLNRVFWETTHKTPRAAARVLAELINGKTERAARLARGMNGLHAHYTADGLALIPFRKAHGISA